MTNPYESAYGHAGDEISSSGEGRIVLIEEFKLVHPTHADNLVDKGDPVAFWDGVGVALKSAQAVTDHVPVDTEGIWRLSVTNTGLNFFGDIKVGQVLFIDVFGVVFDDWTTSFAIFGYALEPIADPGQGPAITQVIAVKAHLMYPYWFYTQEIEV